jgi:hypothetical protein
MFILDLPFDARAASHQKHLTLKCMAISRIRTSVLLLLAFKATEPVLGAYSAGAVLEMSARLFFGTSLKLVAGEIPEWQENVICKISDLARNDWVTQWKPHKM